MSLACFLAFCLLHVRSYFAIRGVESCAATNTTAKDGADLDSSVKSGIEAAVVKPDIKAAIEDFPEYDFLRYTYWMTKTSTLGEGGFGAVFWAKERTPPGHELAVKQQSDVALCESEAQLVQTLGNVPYVIRCEGEGFFRGKTYCYVVLRLAQGYRKGYRKATDLFQFIEKHYPTGLGFGKPLRLMLRQVVLATIRMHQEGVVHYDIKPDNILLDGNLQDNNVPRLRLTDFGCSKFLNEKGRAKYSCGTGLYKAPEVLRGFDATYAADWWSVGVVALEMALGKCDLPIRGKVGNEQMDQRKLVRQLLNSPQQISLRLASSEDGVDGFKTFLTTYFLIIDFTQRVDSRSDESKTLSSKLFMDPFWQGDLDGSWDDFQQWGLDP
eukprot:TRINITY_DN26769_c0_g1_i1.p1 TRINITY_DN26769_c0_g1~~TRINITY_DN26769_c0_g1_i1.p1  ORF type:complete len:382 (+),score=30.12 TRINITY_DN26769_c0_g1_i1:61-1206(+)